MSSSLSFICISGRGADELQYTRGYTTIIYYDQHDDTIRAGRRAHLFCGLMYNTYMAPRSCSRLFGGLGFFGEQGGGGGGGAGAVNISRTLTTLPSPMPRLVSLDRNRWASSAHPIIRSSAEILRVERLLLLLAVLKSEVKASKLQVT